MDAQSGYLSQEEICFILTKVHKASQPLNDSPYLKRISLLSVATKGKETAFHSHNGTSSDCNSLIPEILFIPTWITEKICSDDLCASSIASLRNLEHSALSTVEKGVDEGGTQLWECSVDMVRYLKEHPYHTAGCCSHSLPCNVLELGCGYGLPGLTLLIQQLTRSACKTFYFTFQDLSKKALQYSTLPTLYLTLAQRFSYNQILDCLTQQCKFVFGNWDFLVTHPQLQLLSTVAHDFFFDLIVSCEGIYRTENFPIIQNLIKNHLKPSKNSRAFFAAKRYYFGIGGGSYPFLHFLKENSDTEPSYLEEQRASFLSSQAFLDNPQKSTESCPSPTHLNFNENLLILSTQDSESSQETAGKLIQNKGESISPKLVARVELTIQDGKSNIRDILIVQYA